MGMEGTYRNQPHARHVAKPIHLPLLLAIQQIIMILHADKLGPPALLGHKLHLRKLHRPHATCANVPHLAALDQVMQRLHCLFDRHRVVEAVDLQEIDVRRVETRKRGVDGGEDGGAAEADVVCVVLELGEFVCVLDAAEARVFADGAEAFCQDGEFVAGDVELFDCFADDFFRDAVGVDVGWGTSVEVEGAEGEWIKYRCPRL